MDGEGTEEDGECGESEGGEDGRECIFCSAAAMLELHAASAFSQCLLLSFCPQKA